MYKKMIENRDKKDGYGCLYKIYDIGDDGLGYRYYTNPKKRKYNRGKMYSKIPSDKLIDIAKGKEILKENPIISYMDYSADFGNIRHEGGVSFNRGKKPVKMITQFINYLNLNKNDIIFDFFAGSGTTGDAVMQLNAEDGGKRKYILVQLPEKIDQKKDKTAYDFVKNELKIEEPTIFDITKERLIRSAKKIQEDNSKLKDKDKKDLSNIDFGFKMFETIPIWEDYKFEAEKYNEQISLFDENELSEEDYKTLLVTWKTYDGINLTEDLIKIDFSGYKGYYFDTRLYLINKGFNSDNLKALINKIDEEKEFNPATIYVFGYNFESKMIREISENLKNYSNKKNIDISFKMRY